MQRAQAAGVVLSAAPVGATTTVSAIVPNGNVSLRATRLPPAAIVGSAPPAGVAKASAGIDAAEGT